MATKDRVTVALTYEERDYLLQLVGLPAAARSDPDRACRMLAKLSTDAALWPAWERVNDALRNAATDNQAHRAAEAGDL
jgi:hypothetical protein